MWPPHDETGTNRANSGVSSQKVPKKSRSMYSAPLPFATMVGDFCHSPKRGALRQKRILTGLFWRPIEPILEPLTGDFKISRFNLGPHIWATGYLARQADGATPMNGSRIAPSNCGIMYLAVKELRSHLLVRLTGRVPLPFAQQEAKDD